MKLKNPKVLMQLGLIALVLGSLSLRIQPADPYWADLADGLKGFLYGVAIALLLLFTYINSRRRRGTDDTSCASR